MILGIVLGMYIAISFMLWVIFSDFPKDDDTILRIIFMFLWPVIIPVATLAFIWINMIKPRIFK